MTWNEIYEAADGAACGDDTLKAKDEARHQVRCLAMELGSPDLDNAECPEDAVERLRIRAEEPSGRLRRYEKM